MKKIFADPMMDVKQFGFENVVTSSGTGGNQETTAAEAMREKVGSGNITTVVRFTF